MKVALACCGPLRSFSQCYHTWISNIIIPLEKKIGKGNVKIFMYNCTTNKTYYETNIENSKFNSKIGIDSDGSEHIINNSEYIELFNKYQQNDQYMINIFEEINKLFNTNYNIREIDNYTVPNGTKKKNFFHTMISGICSNYNNKKIIDMIPDDYDLVIKIRPDAYIIRPYPIDTLLNMKTNHIYIQVLDHTIPRIKIPKHNFFKKKLQGKRWDNFYMAHNNTLKHLYHNFFLHCKIMIDTYIQEPDRQHECMPEFLLKNLIENQKIIPEKYFYNGAADKRFSDIMSKDSNTIINYAKHMRFNWFVLKNEHQHIVNKL